jgi:hypothetical protein
LRLFDLIFGFRKPHFQRGRRRKDGPLREAALYGARLMDIHQVCLP